MIIHCSKDFVKRYKIRTSVPNVKNQPSRRIDSWSGHIFKMGSTPFVLFMHDASLWSLIIPAKGITNAEKLLPLFLSRVQEVWQRHGSAFDPQNQSILFLTRKDRSLIGSMNDAIQHIKLLGQSQEITLKQIEDYLQSTPFSAISYDSPERRLKAVLGG